MKENMKKLLKMDDRAVSPVVGVILMVAITVVLAAVIAGFVFSLQGSVNERPTAGISFDENQDEGVVTATLVDEGNINHVKFNYVPSSSEEVGQQFRLNTTGDTTDFLISGSEPNSPSSFNGVDLTSDVNGDGDIQVIGVVDGEETLMQTYTHEDYS